MYFQNIRISKKTKLYYTFYFRWAFASEANKKYGELISEDLYKIFNIKLTDEY